jgi:hypothetical protein
MPLSAAALGYDKPLCASLAGFTLHAATRVGALDPAGRERLLRYVLRPPIAYEGIACRPRKVGAHRLQARVCRWNDSPASDVIFLHLDSGATRVVRGAL